MFRYRQGKSEKFSSYFRQGMVLCVTEKEAHTMLNHMRELQDAGILSAHDGEDPGFVISEGK